MIVHGNTQGLAPSELTQLERLYRRRVPADQLISPELTRAMCEVSHGTGRQVGVMIGRTGTVEFVIVGDATKLMLPDLGRLRAAQGRFRGVRLVHTHLRREPLTRDDLVDLTRLRLDLVAALMLAPDGTPQQVHYAHCVPVSEAEGEQPFRQVGPLPFFKLDLNPASLVSALEEEFARIARRRKIVAKDGRAILVHVCDKRGAGRAQASLTELKELARTAGVDVVDTILQVRDQADPKFVLGRGKLDDVVLRSMQLDADVLIFDRNLTPAQGTAIAQLTDLKVIDRTQLILDIFAQRAESRDGKLQVELAQMRYLLPRLGQKDDSLSRLTGGIGGRGPGETKLEIGRRRARERITHLEDQLRNLSRQRKERRRRRARKDVPIVAIVGYTNAGKSTLLNSLTESSVLAEDKLFATLDTRSRRLRFPREHEVVITDTVGFIRDLPRELFASFRATFEEAEDADLLLHVIDISDPNVEDQIVTTDKLLEELELDQVPRLMVLNKSDALDPDDVERRARDYGGVPVSALDKRTLRPLLERMEHMLFVARGESADLLRMEHRSSATHDDASDDASDDDREFGEPVYAPLEGAHAED
ncbi:MAG: GTPase HflX [Pseudomonadota bacterium]